MAGDDQIGDFAVDLGDWFEAHATEVKKNLERYFLGVGGAPFGGRHFERFSAMGDPNRFEATDVLAVEALSVGVPPNAAVKLLDTEAEDFNSLLRQIPTDKHLWEMPRYVLADNGPAWKLHTRLQKLDDVGWVTAGKLMASKRPLLIPILDDLVQKVLKPPRNRFWSTMREQLSDDHRREKISKVVSFPLGDVTFLRRIDVAVWMHAKVRFKTAEKQS